MKQIVLLVFALAAISGSIAFYYFWSNRPPKWDHPPDAKQNPDGVKKFDPENNRNKLITSLAEQTAWQNYYNKFAPKTGEMAFDFELQDIEGKETFKLSDYRGKQPVALVFGSFT